MATVRELQRPVDRSVQGSGDRATVLRTAVVDPVLSDRILAEYREMPGLRLTVAQASRFWALPAAQCEAIMKGLVGAGRLRRTADGQYCLRTDTEAGQRPPSRPDWNRSHS